VIVVALARVDAAERCEVKPNITATFIVVVLVNVVFPAGNTVFALRIMFLAPVKAVLAAIVPKKFFTVIFFEAGVPPGSSTISNRSSAENVERAVNAETFLSAIIKRL
jgi:hypothetical protein